LATRVSAAMMANVSAASSSRPSTGSFDSRCAVGYAADSSWFTNLRNCRNGTPSRGRACRHTRRQYTIAGSLPPRTTAHRRRCASAIRAFPFDSTGTGRTSLPPRAPTSAPANSAQARASQMKSIWQRRHAGGWRRPWRSQAVMGPKQPPPKRRSVLRFCQHQTAWLSHRAARPLDDILAEDDLPNYCFCQPLKYQDHAASSATIACRY
jgi:hypothetical protein